MKLSFCFLLIVCFASCLNAAPATTWTFTKNADGWHVWGTTPPKEATQQDKDFVSQEFVHWDGNPELGRQGSLRILGHQQGWSCYAISPLIPVPANKDSIFQGWVHTQTQANPNIFVLFSDEKGNFRGGSEGRFYPEYITGEEKNGWTPFSFYIPKDFVPAGGTVMQLAVRPVLTGSNPTGNVWLSDVSESQISNQPISLKAEMNRGFQDDVPGDGKGGWTDQGDNDLRGMKPGVLDVSKIPFAVIDPSQNNAHSVIALRYQGAPGFLEEVNVPLNGAQYDRIYLLHAAAWVNQKNIVGYVDFHYRNGSVASQSISPGEQIGDWWSPGELHQGVPVPLQNVNPQKNPVYLVAASINNPSPDLPIDHLTFRAGNSQAIWLVLAATGSEGPAMRLKTGSDLQRNMQTWQEFVPSIRPTPKNAVSLEFLLDAPAGKHGFVQVKAGHFQFQDGTPVRFWGTNFDSLQAFFPTHQEAELVASTLARYGCNIVRLHLPEYVFVKRSSLTSQTFIDDPDKWDRFDYLIKCLKDKGIYVDMGSITGLSELKFPKESGNGDILLEAPYFDASLQKLGKEFMDHLLLHKNRYTGLRLVDDPVMAFASLINERPLLSPVGSNRSYEAYSKQLQTEFNKWILSRYKNRAGLENAWRLRDGTTALKPGEDPANGTVALDIDLQNVESSLARATSKTIPEAELLRIREGAQFFQDYQYQFFRDMSQHASSIGLKVPLIGTNIVQDLSELATMRSQEMTDQHYYWDLPRGTNVNGVQKWFASNDPEVDVNPTQNGAGIIIGGIKIAGLAVASTENDTPWPADWRSSRLMIEAASSALQENDAIFQYAFGGGFGYSWDTMKSSQAILKPTVEFNDPAIFASFVAGAFLFLRQDVSPAKNLIRFNVNKALSLANEGRLYGRSFPLNYVPFVSRYETFFEQYPAKTKEKPDWTIYDRGDGSQSDNNKLAETLDATLKQKDLLSPNFGIQKGKVISDTGQIVHDYEHQLFLVNTPRSQGFTGFPSHDPIIFPDVQITSASPFATFLLSSLEKKPLKDAKRFFITAVSRADNKDARYSYNGEATMPQGGKRGLGILEEEGKGPVVIEPVRLTLKMKGQKYRLTPLGSDMAPLPEASTEFSGVNGSVNIVLGNGKLSVWYLLEKLS